MSVSSPRTESTQKLIQSLVNLLSEEIWIEFKAECKPAAQHTTVCEQPVQQSNAEIDPKIELKR
jgi:hypothetical protein